MKKVVLFASGSGSNVQRICEYFKLEDRVYFSHLFCNKPDAFVLERAKKLNIPFTVFDKHDFYHSSKILDQLNLINPDLIVLAGFLWLMPVEIVNAFPNKIINIHPALLPMYGGKGMYGMRVHQAVKDNNESISGITVHYVNQHYDEGQVILQKSCEIHSDDSPEDIARKIHELEYEFFPKVIASLLGI